MTSANIQEESTLYKVNKLYHWCIEKTLTTPVKRNGGQYCYDHNGRRFKSESLMCQYWGIDRKTYKYRHSKGLSIEDSLTQKLTQGKKYLPQ